jgi:hypothetical protein
MTEHTTHLKSVSVDDLWLGDWAAEGIAAIEEYLSKHAAFAAFLSARDGLHSTHGDGAAQR